MQDLAGLFPKVVKIRLVQVNLNTHSSSSFYTHLSDDEAFGLMHRFEWHYTPKSASWLNLVEVEFSALARQCLNRRIPSQAQLESEVLAWSAERNRRSVKISWQSTVDQARETLNKSYTKVNPVNIKY